nr:hypothetical protein [Tanacetum cinerariifolium]
MMNEVVRKQLEVATLQVHVQFLQQLQPEWSRFMIIVKQIVDLDKESYHKLFDILKQYQKEVNEICAEKIAKNENTLALVAAAQQYPNTYYQAPKPHRSYAPPAKTSLTGSHATTRHKDKEIAKPLTHLFLSTFEEASDPEQAQRDMDIQKNLALIAKYFKKIYKPTNNNLRTSSNSRNKNVDNTSRYETKREKRLHLSQGKDVVVQTSSESFMAKIQEVLPAESVSDAEPKAMVWCGDEDDDEVVAVEGDSRGVDRGGEGGGMMMVVKWASVRGRRWVAESIPATAPKIMESR